MSLTGNEKGSEVAQADPGAAEDDSFDLLADGSCKAAGCTRGTAQQDERSDADSAEAPADGSTAPLKEEEWPGLGSGSSHCHPKSQSPKDKPASSWLQAASSKLNCGPDCTSSDVVTKKTAPRKSVPKDGRKCVAENQHEGDINIKVWQTHVGFLKGKNGQTLRHIKDETGASIQLDQSKKDQGFSIVRIKPGPGASLAKEMIETKIRIADAADSAECRLEMRIKQPQIGMLIGRAGEIIEQIQDQSGCRVQFERRISMDGCNTLTIAGTRTAIDKAKALVDQKLAGCPGKPAISQEPSSSRPQGDRHDEMKLSQFDVGRVIGTGGDALRAIQRESGTILIMDQSTQELGYSMLRITGPDGGAVEAAKKAVAARIGATGGARLPDDDDLVCRVQQCCVGLLLGRCGATLKKITDLTGACIDVDQSTKDKGYSVVRIRRGKGAQRAKELVAAKVREVEDFDARKMPAAKSEELRVEQHLVKLLVGDGGEVLKQLRDESGAAMVVDQSTNWLGFSTLHISGSHEAVAEALRLVGEKLSRVEAKSSSKRDRRSRSCSRPLALGLSGADSLEDSTPPPVEELMNSNSEGRNARALNRSGAEATEEGYPAAVKEACTMAAKDGFAAASEDCAMVAKEGGVAAVEESIAGPSGFWSMRVACHGLGRPGSRLDEAWDDEDDVEHASNSMAKPGELEEIGASVGLTLHATPNADRPEFQGLDPFNAAHPSEDGSPVAGALQQEPIVAEEEAAATPNGADGLPVPQHDTEAIGSLLPACPESAPDEADEKLETRGACHSGVSEAYRAATPPMLGSPDPGCQREPARPEVTEPDAPPSCSLPGCWDAVEAVPAEATATFGDGHAVTAGQDAWALRGPGAASPEVSGPKTVTQQIDEGDGMPWLDTNASGCMSLQEVGESGHQARFAYGSDIAGWNWSGQWAEWSWQSSWRTDGMGGEWSEDEWHGTSAYWQTWQPQAYMPASDCKERSGNRRGVRSGRRRQGSRGLAHLPACSGASEQPSRHVLSSSPQVRPSGNEGTSSVGRADSAGPGSRLGWASRGNCLQGVALHEEEAEGEAQCLEEGGDVEPSSAEIKVSQYLIGRLLGRSERALEQIRAQTQARLSLDKSTSGEGYSTLRIRGSAAGVARARSLVQEKLAGAKRSDSGDHRASWAGGASRHYRSSSPLAGASLSPEPRPGASRESPRILRAVLTALLGKWHCTAADGRVQRFKVEVTLMPSRLNCAQLACSTLQGGEERPIRFEDGDILLGERERLLLDAISEGHAVWADERQPETHSFWVRGWPTEAAGPGNCVNSSMRRRGGLNKGHQHAVEKPCSRARRAERHAPAKGRDSSTDFDFEADEDFPALPGVTSIGDHPPEEKSQSRCWGSKAAVARFANSFQ